MEVETLIALDVLDAMIVEARRTPPGCFVEVGVYKGGSAFCLAKLAAAQQRPVFLYDTFTGIPYKDEGDLHDVGEFADTSLRDLRATIPWATIVQGIFPGSAVAMPPVAFAHIDCDQYRAVRDAALYLSPRMVQGGVMWFDDYGCLPGATRAVIEVFPDRIERAYGGKALVRF